jgi:hypothetical protein
MVDLVQFVVATMCVGLLDYPVVQDSGLKVGVDVQLNKMATIA